MHLLLLNLIPQDFSIPQDISATKEELLDTVKFFVLKGDDDDLNIHSKEGFTPFHLLVRTKNTEIVEFALTKEANIDAIGIYGYTALHLAILNVDVDMTGLLLRYKANFLITDNAGNTALHYATANAEVDPENADNLQKIISLIAYAQFEAENSQDNHEDTEADISDDADDDTDIFSYQTEEDMLLEDLPTPVIDTFDSI